MARHPREMTSQAVSVCGDDAADGHEATEPTRGEAWEDFGNHRDIAATPTGTSPAWATP